MYNFLIYYFQPVIVFNVHHDALVVEGVLGVTVKQ